MSEILQGAGSLYRIQTPHLHGREGALGCQGYSKEQGGVCKNQWYFTQIAEEL